MIDKLTLSGGVCKGQEKFSEVGHEGPQATIIDCKQTWLMLIPRQCKQQWPALRLRRKTTRLDTFLKHHKLIKVDSKHMHTSKHRKTPDQFQLLRSPFTWNQYHQNISHRTIPRWNRLSEEVVAAPHLDTFEPGLKTTCDPYLSFCFVLPKVFLSSSHLALQVKCAVLTRDAGCPTRPEFRRRSVGTRQKCNSSGVCL